MHATLLRGWSLLQSAAARLLTWGPAMYVRARPIYSLAVLLTAIAALSLLWARSCGLRGCPSLADLRAYRPSEGVRVLDRHGATLGYLRPVRRVSVKLDAIPQVVREAFIAVEDRRFLSHDGFDWHGAVRAAWVNLSHLDMRQGSSTITMQAARSAFLERYEGERSVRRKLIELHLAGRLEAALEKPQILELYLNTIYLGDGTYGVEAASRHYFGKSVTRLSLAEAAMLAGLPRAPSTYDPRRHPVRARRRRDLVLTLMTEQRFVTPAAAAKARSGAVRVTRTGWRPEAGPSDALDLVRTAMDSLIGEELWRRGDLVVQTTFDLEAQRAATRAVRDRAAAIGRAEGRRIGDVQGAMVAMDPQNGELRAVVGSSVTAPGGLNRAMLSRRQPGSAFKPFVYAAALERGFTPLTLVSDEPVTVARAGRSWSPQNFGGEYQGTVTLRDALAHSLNAATVRVSQDVGISPVIALARRAGITSPLGDVPSLALGSAEVTPVELVRAYAAFGNGGYRVSPSYLVSISTRDGARIWQRAQPMRVRALDERDAFVLTAMLRAVVDEGTGSVIRRLGVQVPMAGKTGTSNDGADVWFVGYTRTVVAGFWFGYDTPRSLGYGASGGRLAAPAFAAFYRRGWNAGDDAAGWDVPEGVSLEGGETHCGFLGLGECTTTPEAWLRDGTDPGERAAQHREEDDEHHREDSDDDDDDDDGDQAGSRAYRTPGLPDLRASLSELDAIVTNDALRAQVRTEILQALREAEREMQRASRRRRP